MKNPILILCRRWALRRGRSTVPTTLLPLSKIRSATVYVDASAAEEDPVRVGRAVKQFFDYHGIPVLILCPQKGDLNVLGYLKQPAREPDGPRHEDLFISLAASPEDFAAEYEASCSRARFKVGRCRLPGNGVYDLVVEAPESGEASQTAAFSAIKDYLNKIR